MNVYLDIDGVLLANDKFVAPHVDEFVAKCLERGEVYWLTTWCRGDSAPAIRRLAQTNMNPATIELLAKHAQPTNWHTAKTEAIDLSKPFLWFDDDLFPDERAELIKYGMLGNWIEVDLHKNPKQLLTFVRSFPIPITDVA